MLIVPQQARQRFVTELGVIDAEPQEIVVIPRGVRFRVELLDGTGPRLRLRELRRHLPPARPRPDRLQRPGQPARLPDAGRRATKTSTGRTQLVAKFGRHLWSHASWTTRRSTSSPGTATTRRTSTTCAASTPIGSISYDHPDPSIFTVLHRAVRHAGHGNIDFVIFPPRWLVARTPSARPGSTATSRASSWAWSTAPTTPRPRASRPAAPACTTA